ncbi:hypothetical protein JCM9279_006512 [Rhodotorula babjevae]
MDDERLYSFAIPPPTDDTPSAPVPLVGERFVHPSRVQLSTAALAGTHNRRHDAAPNTGPAATRAAHSKKRDAPAPVEDEDESAPAPAAAAAAADDDDEPKPLSHKEKRLAKKRKLAAEAAGLDPDAPAPSSAPAPTSSGPTATTIGTTLVGNTPGRSAHGIWVGNMNYATHPRELLAWFAGHGLKDVVRINMPGGKRSHENNRGFAYLDFPTVEDQEAAVACSEKNLDGRKLLIKASSDYTGRPAPAPGAGAAPGGAVKDVLASLDPSALERPDPRAAAAASSAAAAVDGAAPTSSTAGAGAAPPTLNRTARKILSRQKNAAGPTLFLGNLGFETTVDDIRDMFDRNQVRSSEWAPKGKEDQKACKGKKGGNGKGKGKAEEGEEEEEEEGEDEGEGGEEDKADTDRDDDESDDDESSEEDKEGGERDAGDKKKRREDKKAKGPKDLAKAKDAGIRKIRIGTFEDTGKCKGWAFVDFHLAAQSTRALLNLHNHQLNGRKLNVEYASPEAVRRGQLGSRAVSKQHGRQRREAPAYGDDGAGADDGYGERAERAGGGRKRGEREWDDGDVRSFAAEAVADAAAQGPPQRQRREKQPRERREREPQALPGGKRAKPGAALAMAQRASEAIVASTGRKVTFD